VQTAVRSQDDALGLTDAASVVADVAASGDSLGLTDSTTQLFDKVLFFDAQIGVLVG
jgi:hypothetical protein